MQRSLQHPHPRRPPAHLSVSLRQDGSTGPTSRAAEPAVEVHLSTAVPPVRKASDESNNSGDGVQNWFDRSNKRPETRIDHRFEDNESPYFLRQHSSSKTSSIVSESSPNRQSGCAIHHKHAVAGLPYPASKGSSVGDYRSVIDDLTIENRKLKERLRKYEAAYSTPLEKDMLFEVKVHGLAANKKRELEETLRSFAASVDGLSDTSAKVIPRGAPHQTSIPSKNTSSSSSISRPVDSAYASMCTSGATPTSKPNLIGVDRNAHNEPSNKNQKVQSFLHNIPEGLLPKHSMVMTERQKKKLVVRRLEQLFTGKRDYTVGDHSQPLQQQEVSESAAMADRAVSLKRSSGEGVREANILPYEMEVDSTKPKVGDDLSNEMADSKGPSDSAAEDSPDSSLEQRPTRPLDLDPDRTQIPSDNVEYLRHLGLPAPSFERGTSGDVEADAERWIYLNLLINMAQLHIINVTTDFVRSAVADVSDKFQLSRDGRKIRWRGGTDGTRFSSDNGTNSGKNGYPMDSDRLDEGDQKRRKIDVGRFASVPLETSNRKEQSTAAQHNPLYYKPLFHHQESSSEELTSCGESESPLDYGTGYADSSEAGKLSRAPRLRSRRSHSKSEGRVVRRNDGPIVFYSNAQFCTDLSGDRGISIPLHETGVGRDGYSNHTRDAMGCTPRTDAPSVSRTSSGSFLPFRPFKDYSKGYDPFQTSETRPKTPDLVVNGDSDLDISLGWASSHSAPAKNLMSFDASGLGGTQPADHFAVTVKTRRTKLSDHRQARLSKFYAVGPGSRKFLHTIPKSPLKKSQQSVRANSEGIASGLASLRASSPPKGEYSGDLPIQAEVVSAKFFRLKPSALPPPMGYYATLSSSDSDSDVYSNSSSFSGISHLRGQKPFLRTSPSPALGSIPNIPPGPKSVEKEQDSDEMQDDEDDDEDDDSDESIDMLASARVADPHTVAAKEEEFERQAVQRLEEVLAGSSAATVDSGSGFSKQVSECESSDEDTDMN